MPLLRFSQFLKTYLSIRHFAFPLQPLLDTGFLEKSEEEGKAIAGEWAGPAAFLRAAQVSVFKAG